MKKPTKLEINEPTKEEKIIEIYITKNNYTIEALENMTDEQIEREWEHVFNQRTEEQR